MIDDVYPELVAGEVEDETTGVDSCVLILRRAGAQPSGSSPVEPKWSRGRFSVEAVLARGIRLMTNALTVADNPAANCAVDATGSRGPVCPTALLLERRGASRQLVVLGGGLPGDNTTFLWGGNEASEHATYQVRFQLSVPLDREDPLSGPVLEAVRARLHDLEARGRDSKR